ncbi:MAG: HEAT repeat domain-containing protein, partial [bacterium]|nr:HEAT repeat domain-containing protein [bacterium]
GWEALSGITELLGTIRNEKHHSTVCDYLASFGQQNLHIVSRGMSDKNPTVVASSIQILGRLDDDRVYPYLDKAITHESPSVRSQLIETLAANGSEQSTEMISRLARDRNPDIRREAIRALSKISGEFCFNIIAELINDDTFSKADQDEQQLLLNSLSQRGGEHAVSYLRTLILKYNFIQSRTFAFLRMAAFEALSLNSSDKAEKTLVRMAGNWRPGIRRMARDAMNRRRAIIYGAEE